MEEKESSVSSEVSQDASNDSDVQQDSGNTPENTDVPSSSDQESQESNEEGSKGDTEESSVNTSEDSENDEEENLTESYTDESENESESSEDATEGSEEYTEDSEDLESETEESETSEETEDEQEENTTEEESTEEQTVYYDEDGNEISYEEYFQLLLEEYGVNTASSAIEYPLYETFEEFQASPVYVTRYEYEILNKLEFIQYALCFLIALIFLLIFTSTPFLLFVYLLLLIVSYLYQNQKIIFVQLI